MAIIGIRHEDKNRWEARAPLVPQDLQRLITDHGLDFCVQESPTRAFGSAEYVAAGAKMVADLSDCPIIMGIKEIPVAKLLPERTYLCFSHTIKAQPANMPTLRRLMELNCQLIDYEKIADAQGRRSVFFGRYAGLAGMIDSLWALGRRLQFEEVDNPFSIIRQAYEYKNLQETKVDLARVSKSIQQGGLPEACRPMVCGFAGYGQVSQGAQEIFGSLPVTEISPEEVSSVSSADNTCFKVVFQEKHLVDRIGHASPFELQEYYDHPERYRGRFHNYLPHLTILITGIYWESKYPRLVTRDALRELYAKGSQPNLRVIGDISCDIEGSIECTVRTTEPDNPVFVYEPSTGKTRDGVGGQGPVILAVDNLPCELPVDSSIHFSQSLSPFVPALAKANFAGKLADSGLPDELIRATMVYHGSLTEPYRYLERSVR